MNFRKREIAASIVWFAVAGLFAVVMIAHVRDRSFSYKHLSMPARPDAGERSETPPAQVNPYNLGENANGGILLTPGKTIIPSRQKLQVGGSDLDEPLRAFVESVNAHIDGINKDKLDESFYSMILDIIGVLTSLFSAFYELRKTGD